METEDTFWEQYGHFVGCTVRESNSAVGIVTGVTNDGEPMLHIRRRNGKIDKRKPSDVHKTCACGKRALDSNGKVCPGHENCRPLACAPPEPEECPGPHDDGPLNYCPTCSWSRTSSATVATEDAEHTVAWYIMEVRHRNAAIGVAKQYLIDGQPERALAILRQVGNGIGHPDAAKVSENMVLLTADEHNRLRVAAGENPL